jgi:hypothetical protein
MMLWWLTPLLTMTEYALAIMGPTERQRQAQERRRQFRVIEGGKRA